MCYLEHYNLTKNVAVWSFMTLFFWGIRRGLVDQSVFQIHASFET